VTFHDPLNMLLQFISITITTIIITYVIFETVFFFRSYYLTNSVKALKEGG